MLNPVRRNIFAAVIVVIALGLITVGAVKSYKVYEPGSAEFGILAFEKVGDAQLVIDATFSGVCRKEGKLFSTYDRTVVQGKRPCPT